MDTLQELTPERFRLGFDVDVGGTLALTQAAAPHLRGGTVVNLIAARGGASPGAAHLSVSAVAGGADRAHALPGDDPGRDDVAVHGLMPQITPAGGTGRPPRRSSASSSASASSPRIEVGEAVSRAA